jgi:hypothetical protein
VRRNMVWWLFIVYKFRDGIQITQVFTYCGEYQSWPVINASSILG